MSRSGGLSTAGKYLTSQVLLTGAGLGGVLAGAITHPCAAVVLGPLALVLGIALGYGWRDAVGDWQSHRALVEWTERQARNTASMTELLKAGVIPADRGTRNAMGIPEPALRASNRA